jgi:predicted enzyme related to lactoylglutathione lyase
VDLRVGGEYCIRAHSEQYGDMEVIGVYREVKHPSRLVYTWGWSEGALSEIDETVVTVDFVNVDGDTEVHLRHEGFPGTELRDQHSYGWNGCFDKLEKMLGGSASGGMCGAVGEFSWNELVTQDVAGATAFYTKLFGWQMEKFGASSPDKEYMILKAGNTQVGGMMKMPMPGAPSSWLAYVTVADCDASVKQATGLCGKVCVEPFDVPMVGRIAVLKDPQGASFGLFQPLKK